MSPSGLKFNKTANCSPYDFVNRLAWGVHYFRNVIRFHSTPDNMI